MEEESGPAFGAQQTSEAVRGCGVGRAGEGMGAVFVSACVYVGGHWAAVCVLSNDQYAERYGHGGLKCRCYGGKASLTKGGATHVPWFCDVMEL